MNKEWLEDKKKQLNNATIFINENGNEAVEVSLAVLNKLFEQAERVEELEELEQEYVDLNSDFTKLALENKRYREAIEKIKKTSDNYRAGHLLDIQDSFFVDEIIAIINNLESDFK